MSKQPVYRFAPSPNGRLHLGHALSALLNQKAAIETHGRMLLRIEDIDTARCTEENVAAIFEDLAWLGLKWEEPVRRQSKHFDFYAQALDQLNRMGLIYRSYLTRKEIAAEVAAAEAAGRSWPHDPDNAPHAPRDADVLTVEELNQRKKNGEPFCLRLDMTRALTLISSSLTWREIELGVDGSERLIPAAPERWGDVILSRKDTPASYHLAVTVDDALQGVTHVIRGQDLYHATSVHRLLQELLKLPAPRYHHHRLLTDAGGEKLSKSRNDTALHAMRSQGITRTDVQKLINYN